MKLMAVGYYDDFARFFLSIKKELKKEVENVEFTYISLYFSGFIYFIVRLQSVSFFSFKVWIYKIINQKKFQKIAAHGYYKNIDLNRIIKYHSTLDDSDEIDLKLQAIAYIDIIEKLLKDKKPDILILSSDSRMSIEIFNIKAQELNLRIYYFEQGPFGTTILDSKGVNANASIRNKIIKYDDISFDEKKQKIENFFQKERRSKYKRNPLYRGSDYLFQTVFSLFGLLPVDIKMEKNSKSLSRKYTNLATKIDEEKNIFLLILQVPYDVNMVYHSPFYNNHYSIVKDIYDNLPAQSQLIVREHPLYQGKYEKELYDFMFDKSITLDKKELYDSIDHSNVIIVNNSTVGIEAIARLKPVIVLGNSYYDNVDICLKLKNKEQLSKLLSTALNYKIDNYAVIDFLYQFLFYFLLDGHFRDEKLIVKSSVVKRLLNDI